MGLLDTVLGGVLGGLQGGGTQAGAGAGSDALVRAVIGMLGNDSPQGGLAGLVQAFSRNGMGDVVQSWISSGQNMPVSSSQLQDALGYDTIDSMARQIGVDHGDLASQLSQVLPQVVDRLTPQGQMPQGGLGNVTDLLGQLLAPR